MEGSAGTTTGLELTHATGSQRQLDQFHDFCEVKWGGRPRPQPGPLAGLIGATRGSRAGQGPAPHYKNYETGLAACV
jgi:hypothetical protein